MILYPSDDVFITLTASTSREREVATANGPAGKDAVLPRKVWEICFVEPSILSAGILTISPFDRALLISKR